MTHSTADLDNQDRLGRPPRDLYIPHEIDDEHLAPWLFGIGRWWKKYLEREQTNG